MSRMTDTKEGRHLLVMGNEAIVRGALEAGVNVVAGYPGTPSSEIVERLSEVAKERNIYVEWSTNEKVAAEVAASGSFAGLRCMCTMKQNGVNVASDFLIHLAVSGTRGGMVVMVCDDPGALSSLNESETGYLAKQFEIPMIEAGDFQEAKDMTKWAFELSEEIRLPVMMRSVTRLSHASGNVLTGALPGLNGQKAKFKCDHPFPMDPDTGGIISALLSMTHPILHRKMAKARQLFEHSPFNTYMGPENPELLIITRSVCNLYCRESIRVLDVSDRVGLLKIGTSWPMPSELIKKHLRATDKVLFVEEVLPFMEENIKVIVAENMADLGIKTFYGKNDGTVPAYGELNPDLVIAAIRKILGIEFSANSEEYQKKAMTAALHGAPPRDMTFCPGCPHRASFWNIHNALQQDNRQGFVCGDIGCYTMAAAPCGFSTVKTLHAMGSGAGVACGFGKLGQFGMDQPVMAVCGDSTFFHAVMPALVNAVHNRSKITLVVLDNGGTAMTGFQPHPGLDHNVLKEPSPKIDIAAVCRAIGAHVEICDSFDLKNTRDTLLRVMNEDTVNVVIMKQMCKLSPEKKHTRKYAVKVDEARCLGENCRLCTNIFRCPGLYWDKEKKITGIDEILCAGCGVCADICPSGAIESEEA